MRKAIFLFTSLSTTTGCNLIYQTRMAGIAVQAVPAVQTSRGPEKHLHGLDRKKPVVCEDPIHLCLLACLTSANSRIIMDFSYAR